MSKDINTLLSQAAKWIINAESGARFRVVSHYDADGITAAAIICKTLMRLGFDFHVSLMRNPFTKGIERIKEEKNTHIIFTDMGSGQLPMLEELDANILILDHHQLKTETTKDHIFQVNVNSCGINGNYDACGSTLSYSVSKKVDANNIDLSGLAIAGATGDKQYIGGFKGFNKTLIEDAVNNHAVKEHTGLKLSEPTVSESLYYSVEPYYMNLSGDYDQINHFLTKLQIDKEQPYMELSNQKREDLHSALMLHLMKQGCETTILETVIRTRYTSDMTYGEMEQFADLLDSCGKGGYRDLGLALSLGDEKNYKKAKTHERTFKQDLLDELHRIESEGVNETSSYRYFFTDQTSLGGVIGGIATNFILDTKKPLLSIARKKDEIHISCRGNQNLVKNGLDLGGAMSSIAKKLNGHGGGHKIAAGATLPIDAEETFIKETEKLIHEQLKSQKNEERI